RGKPHNVMDVISTQLLVCDRRISIVEYGLPVDFSIPNIVRNINLIAVEGDAREVQELYSDRPRLNKPPCDLLRPGPVLRRAADWQHRSPRYRSNLPSG